MSANTFLPPSPVTPPFLIVTNITNAFPCVATVSTSNSYVVGQLVHFSVPPPFGMIQMDQQIGQILSIDVTNLIFTINIDTTNFNVFTTPSGNVQKPASLSSAGSRNLYNIAQVPFHSVGNTGN